MSRSWDDLKFTKSVTSEPIDAQSKEDRQVVCPSEITRSCSKVKIVISS